MATLNESGTQGTPGGAAIAVDPSGVTSPISAASLPLPAGAALSATQTLELAALNEIALNSILMTERQVLGL